MKISSAFPSNYLKCSDLQDRNVKVLMDRVEMEDLGGDQKPILYFQGKDKGLVLNKTNSNNIAAAYGDDTEEWSGREIILYPAMTDFQGKTVPCIRVRAPTAKDRPRPALKVANQSEDQPQDMDDEIPF
jgi:arabinogalactan endo-1,4-beta-galactosidase